MYINDVCSFNPDFENHFGQIYLVEFQIKYMTKRKIIRRNGHFCTSLITASLPISFLILEWWKG